MDLRPRWITSNEPLPDPLGLGQAAVDFIQSLILPSCETFKLIREQERIVRKVFGDVDPKTGRRLAQTVYLHLPSGSAKSTLAAACAVLMLSHPLFRIKAGQLVIAAATREQARSTAFGIVEGFIRRRYPDEDELAARYRIVSNALTQEIEHLASGSVLKVTSRSPAANEGQSLVFILAEETHAWTRQADRLWDVLVKSQAKVTATTPLAMIATTAGVGIGGIGHRLYSVSCDIASGKVKNTSWLPVIYAADPDEDWKSEKIWRRVTFGLGRYKSIEVLRNLAMLAETSAIARAEFQRYHLNIWHESVTDPWITPALFDAEAIAAPFDVDAVKHLPAYIGVDAGQTDDLTAVVVVFHDEEAGQFYVLPHIWCPADSITRRSQDDGVPYANWLESEEIIATAGAAIDEDVIEAKILELCEAFDVRRIGFDPYATRRMMSRLYDEGLPVIAVPQSFRFMSPAMKNVERAILNGAMRHGGHEALRWAFLNVPAPVPTHDGNIKPSKKDRNLKIDPAVATMIAFVLCTVIDPQAEYGFTDLTGLPEKEATNG